MTFGQPADPHSGRPTYLITLATVNNERVAIRSIFTVSHLDARYHTHARIHVDAQQLRVLALRRIRCSQWDLRNTPIEDAPSPARPGPLNVPVRSSVESPVTARSDVRSAEHQRGLLGQRPASSAPMALKSN